MVFTSKLACVAFAMLKSLQPWHEDVDEPNRDARLAVIAEAEAVAVERAATPPCLEAKPECAPAWGGDRLTLLAGVTAVGNAETHFAARIHAGECRPHECDPIRRRDGTVWFQAHSLWQLHPWVRGWDKMVGTELEPTTTAAVAAARLAAFGWNSCGNGHLGAVSRFAGRGCEWAGGRGRVAVWVRLESVGRAAAAECE